MLLEISTVGFRLWFFLMDPFRFRCIGPDNFRFGEIRINKVADGQQIQDLLPLQDLGILDKGVQGLLIERHLMSKNWKKTLAVVICLSN